MKKLSGRKCPVCGSRELRKFGTYGDQRQCETCGTTDQAAQFPRVPKTAPTSEGATAYHLDDQHTVIQHVPPEEVQKALALIEDFFASRNVKTWAFGGVQSRSETSLAENALRGPTICAPTMTLQDVGRLAAAFRCEVIPRITPEIEMRLAEWLSGEIGTAWAFADSEEKIRCLSIAQRAILHVKGIAR
jgi:hypothetical protein